MQKTVIIVCGPTAVGKTAAGILLAQYFNTHIISADSRQCYKELNIAVAKPTPAELSSVKHYFINSHTIHEEVNAAGFEQYALAAAEKIFSENQVAVMVGGTGLYLKAFCEGLDEIPAINADLRKKIITAYVQNGISWLQEEVQKNDPLFWQQAEQRNPQRLMRALEVKLSTGFSVLAYRSGKKQTRPFRILKTGIALPKELLNENIDLRVDRMMEEGLLQEATGLWPLKNLNALQTVGYRELFNYLDGHCTFEQAVNMVKANTRKYAKRQMTWFKKDKEISWHIVGRETGNQVIEQVLQQLKKNQ